MLFQTFQSEIFTPSCALQPITLMLHTKKMGLESIIYLISCSYLQAQEELEVEFKLEVA